MTITDYLKLATEVLGAVSALSTALAHAPFIPARAQAFLARFGIATGKFAVVNTNPVGVSPAKDQS